MVPGPLGLVLAVVAGVGQYEAQSFKQYEAQSFKSLLGQVLQGCFAADPVVLMGRPDVGGQQQAARINQQLALAALDFFVAVEVFVHPPARCI